MNKATDSIIGDNNEGNKAIVSLDYIFWQTKPLIAAKNNPNKSPLQTKQKPIMNPRPYRC